MRQVLVEFSKNSGTDLALNIVGFLRLLVLQKYPILALEMPKAHSQAELIDFRLKRFEKLFKIRITFCKAATRPILLECILIIELFSKRQKRLRGDVPDVYAYDILPNPLRVQAIQIIQETVGEDRSVGNRRRQFFENIHKVLCHELGRFSLTDNNDKTAE
ncbi:hypothetical protein, partial [Aquidulcibacter sp.]|uniref:hypothetical protein n=1 Tax=Aquidulcibacter sp. TaxID=2052990 RepID=UPI0025C3837E